MSTVTLRARTPTAQRQVMGIDAVTYTMDEEKFSQYINMPVIQLQIRNLMTRLNAAGFMPSLIILNGGETIRVEVFSTSNTLQGITTT